MILFYLFFLITLPNSYSKTNNFYPSKCNITNGKATNEIYKTSNNDITEVVFVPQVKFEIYPTKGINETFVKGHRKQFQLYLSKEGLFKYLNTGELLDSNNGVTRLYKFIWDHTGIYASKNGEKHNDLGLKIGVYTAGYFSFKQGILAEISNFSGHYQPDHKSLDPLLHLLKLLKIKGIDKLKVNRVESFGGFW